MSNQEKPIKGCTPDEIRTKYRWFVSHFDPFKLQICFTVITFGGNIPLRNVLSADQIGKPFYKVSIDQFPEGFSEDIKQSGCIGYSIMSIDINSLREVKEHWIGFPFLNVAQSAPLNPNNRVNFFARLISYYNSNGISLSKEGDSIESIKKIWEDNGMESIDLSGRPSIISKDNKEQLERLFDFRVKGMEKLSKAEKGEKPAETGKGDIRAETVNIVNVTGSAEIGQIQQAGTKANQEATTGKDRYEEPREVGWWRKNLNKIIIGVITGLILAFIKSYVF